MANDAQGLSGPRVHRELREYDYSVTPKSHSHFSLLRTCARLAYLLYLYPLLALQYSLSQTKLACDIARLLLQRGGSPSKTTVTSAANNKPGPHKPVADNYCSTSNKHSLGLANMNDDNETKGAQAFDRISQIARGEDDRGRAPNKRVRRLKTLPFSSVKATSIVIKRRLLDDDAISTADTRDEDDLAEAIARSLQDVPACPPGQQPENHHSLDGPDMMEIEATAFTPSRRLRKPASQARSYKNLGSNSASTKAAPHEALHGLLNIMDASVKTLDRCALEGIQVDAQELVDHIRNWQGRIRKVIHASEMSEQRRIKDLQAQLDFDRDVEETHRNNINKLNQSWTETMHEQEKEWQKESNKLQQMIETKPQPNEPTESLAQLHATNRHPTKGVQRRC